MNLLYHHWLFLEMLFKLGEKNNFLPLTSNSFEWSELQPIIKIAAPCKKLKGTFPLLLCKLLKVFFSPTFLAPVKWTFNSYRSKEIAFQKGQMFTSAMLDASILFQVGNTFIIYSCFLVSHQVCPLFHSNWVSLTHKHMDENKQTQKNNTIIK